MAEINGHCDPKLQRVADAFTECFTKHGEIGASVSATVEGEMVVDLWGGSADAELTRPWKEDTICGVHSAGKGVLATVTHMLVDRGQVDLDLPIAYYWPEYAQNGKENITLRQVLAHTAGMAFIDAELYVGAPFDWETMAEACAAQKPEWAPGSTHGYHAITFGWIVGEVLRRVTGEMPGSLIAREITKPLNAEFYIGLAESQDRLVADTVPPPPPASDQSPEIPSPPPTYDQRSTAMLLDYIENGINAINSREWRGAQIPASNPYGNARGLATIYRPLAMGGDYGGVDLMSQETIDAAIVEQVSGNDIVLEVDAVRATGYKLVQLDFGEFLGPRSFGHPGAGGSAGFADPDHHVSFGYVMNRFWDGPRGSDPGKASLAEAIYGCL